MYVAYGAYVEIDAHRQNVAPRNQSRGDNFMYRLLTKANLERNKYGSASRLHPVDSADQLQPVTEGLRSTQEAGEPAVDHPTRK